ncbi:hypothetical protein MAR_032466 [Mya arenaria]|uniref:Uncharacterized protein n=1 Tax=Mya arenaria TaxID=6604 RepID=A0ABY7F6Q8_MYAAR|nr:hypothetical protein MAR_032466 [Mya arenaria]
MRRDESFRNKGQEKHHINDTPFCLLPIDMIYTFSVDYMHRLKKYIPNIFSRKPRGLDELDG